MLSKSDWDDELTKEAPDLLTLITKHIPNVDRTTTYCVANMTHDDFNTDKVCSSANPAEVGFVYMYLKLLKTRHKCPK